jgi:hypothetical protein
MALTRTVIVALAFALIAVAHAKAPAPAPRESRMAPKIAPKESKAKTPAPAPIKERDCATLWDFVNYYPQYSLLKAAIESSPELEKFAQGCKKNACPQEYTILTPTDRTIESFARGIGSNLTDLFDDQARLEDIVRNHIIVNNNGTFTEGEELETALPSSSLGVFHNTEGTQTCFMSWSYACADGIGEDIKMMNICQGRTIKVNSMVMPPLLESGTTAGDEAATTAGRRL